MRWLSDRTVERLRRVAELPDLGETKYRLIEELGRGGMGTVYLAEDRVLGRKVALKVVSTAAATPELADRMRREARVIARLEHPGIVPVHDSGALPDGRIFYAMKRVDGRRLDELAGGATRPERLRIFQRVCEAVAFAHAHGVIHRDLKPQNVMVGRFGEVLVMDWGVAKLFDGASDGGEDGEGGPATPVSGQTAGETAEGTVVGTLGYMAPEQAEARGDAFGPATDVYALGALLYYLLTLRPPFSGEAAERRARGGASEPPVPARTVDPGLPRSLAAIAEKAMAASPENRYPSAEALSADVALYLDGERVLAHRETPWERAGRFFSRYRTWILLVAAYLAVRTALLLWGGR